jgi:hypothetical protein
MTASLLSGSNVLPYIENLIRLRRDIVKSINARSAANA